MVTTKIFPKCSHCQREFRPGDSWSNANFCRALFLYETLLRHESDPQTTWELCRATGMPYDEGVRAMQKLDQYGLVEHEEEERPGGGRRFRYLAIVNDKDAWARFAAKLPAVARVE